MESGQNAMETGQNIEAIVMGKEGNQKLLFIDWTNKKFHEACDDLCVEIKATAQNDGYSAIIRGVGFDHVQLERLYNRVQLLDLGFPPGDLDCFLSAAALQEQFVAKSAILHQVPMSLVSALHPLPPKTALPKILVAKTDRTTSVLVSEQPCRDVELVAQSQSKTTAQPSDTPKAGFRAAATNVPGARRRVCKRPSTSSSSQGDSDKEIETRTIKRLRRVTQPPAQVQNFKPIKSQVSDPSSSESSVSSEPEISGKVRPTPRGTREQIAEASSFHVAVEIPPSSSVFWFEDDKGNLWLAEPSDHLCAQLDIGSHLWLSLSSQQDEPQLCRAVLRAIRNKALRVDYFYDTAELVEAGFSRADLEKYGVKLALSNHEQTLQPSSVCGLARADDATDFFYDLENNILQSHEAQVRILSQKAESEKAKVPRAKSQTPAASSEEGESQSSSEDVVTFDITDDDSQNEREAVEDAEAQSPIPIKLPIPIKSLQEHAWDWALTPRDKELATVFGAKIMDEFELLINFGHCTNARSSCRRLPMIPHRSLPERGLVPPDQEKYVLLATKFQRGTCGACGLNRRLTLSLQRLPDKNHSAPKSSGTKKSEPVLVGAECGNRLKCLFQCGALLQQIRALVETRKGQAADTSTLEQIRVLVGQVYKTISDNRHVVEDLH
jgi:hypothetical protein